MIPFGIMSGMLYGLCSRPLEIRILELWAEGFTFRLSNQYPKARVEKITSISLSFLNWSQMEEQRIFLTDFVLSFREKTEWYSVYEVRVIKDDWKTGQQNDFRNASSMVMREYLEYINLKMEAEPADLSESLTGYPAEQDEVYPDSVEDWKRQLFHNSLIHRRGDWDKVISKIQADQMEIAMTIGRPALYQKYLTWQKGDPESVLWAENNLMEHGFSDCSIDTVLIGNNYCAHLFPDKDMLIRLFEHTLQLKLKPVIVLSPVQTGMMNTICKAVSALEAYFPAMKKEYVVNDWGMAHWLHRTFGDRCEITLGILLNKRRKDVRMAYKKQSSFSGDLMKENQLNDNAFRAALKEKLGITKFSYEACGYPFHMAAGHHVLHLPFYQMNTAGFCTLYASVNRKNRGDQLSVKPGSCPMDCEKKAFLYPQHLNMAGLGNSLFGYDRMAMENAEYLYQLISEQPSRLVFDLLD